MKSVNTQPEQKRISIRMAAIGVCVISVVATAVFGVIERVRVEHRLDAIEQSNQETASALAMTGSSNELFERNYRLTKELLGSMKSMSRNMSDLTAAFKGMSKRKEFHHARVRRANRRMSVPPGGKAKAFPQTRRRSRCELRYQQRQCPAK